MKIISVSKSFIYIVLLLILILNVGLIYRRFDSNIPTFNQPVALEAVVNNPYVLPGKTILFVFVKPQCFTCNLYKDSLLHLHKKFNHSMQFIGLCNPKYWDADYLNNYGFEFKKIDNTVRKSLHLAVTPQIILVENGKVSFSQNFNIEFKDEFNRFKQYLEERYVR